MNINLIPEYGSMLFAMSIYLLFFMVNEQESFMKYDIIFILTLRTRPSNLIDIFKIIATVKRVSSPRT